MTDPDSPAAAADNGSLTGGELRKLARGGSLSLVGVMANAILGFLFVGLLSHTLVVGTAAALFEAIAIFTICSNATELGADTGLLRLMTIYRRRQPSDLRRLTLVAFVPAFVCSSIAALLVILYAPQLTHVFVHKAPHADTPTDLRILAAFLAAQTTETVLATGIRSWSIKPFISIIYFFVPLSRIVLLGIVYAIGLTPRLAAVAWAAPIGVAFVMALVMTEVYLRRESHRRPAGGRAGPRSSVQLPAHRSQFLDVQPAEKSRRPLQILDRLVRHPAGGCLHFGPRRRRLYRGQPVPHRGHLPCPGGRLRHRPPDRPADGRPRSRPGTEPSTACRRGG